MDPVTNPFAPGAGTPPPELAGRGDLQETVRIAIERTRRGYPAKNVVMVGLRGVGKTVLLDRMREDAEVAGIYTIRIEAPENRSLPAMLAPQLRQVLLRLSRVERAKDLAQRGLRGLAGLVGALKFKYQDIEVGLDLEPEPGLADSGDLEVDLPDLLEAAATAATAANTALILFIDEIQYVEEAELGALITALHRSAQRRLPVLLVGAGLPQLRAKMGRAKSYSERLFEFPEVGALREPDARLAIVRPIEAERADEAERAEIERSALQRIIELTHCYPYFLQEWGKHAWDTAPASPITLADVDLASETAIADLDASFFLVRFDRLTRVEKKYMRAMAELGPGPHRSGDIAAKLNRDVRSLGPTRAKLISKGMLWSPSHGDTAYTVPLFDEFMKRIMPEFEP